MLTDDECYEILGDQAKGRTPEQVREVAELFYETARMVIRSSREPQCDPWSQRKPRGRTAQRLKVQQSKAGR